MHGSELSTVYKEEPRRDRECTEQDQGTTRNNSEYKKHDQLKGSNADTAKEKMNGIN